MNSDKMQKIAAYLERISADDKQKLVDDMAKNAPYLFAGNIDMSDKEKATTLIKMQINILSDAHFGMESITTFEHSFGFVQGLIVGCAMGGLLTEQEEATFKKEAIAVRNSFYKTP